MDNKKVFVNVFITKNNKFRARIIKPEFTTEITVGGKSWNEGKESEYKEVILLKCSKLLSSLTEQVNLSL